VDPTDGVCEGAVTVVEALGAFVLGLLVRVIVGGLRSDRAPDRVTLAWRNEHLRHRREDQV
jgi:hypothetical protein